MNKKINIINVGMTLYNIILVNNKLTKCINIYSKDEKFLGYIDNRNYYLKFEFKAKDEYFYRIEYKNKK